MQTMKERSKAMFLAQSAVFAAILCVMSPLAVPIGPIPITLGVFAVMLTGAVLDWKRAGAAVLTYLLLGCVGLPVFSGGKGGFAVLAGPTGGYLWSYLPMAMMIAALGAKPRERAWMEALSTFAACEASMLLLYLLGTFQFTLVANSDWGHALTVCVYPFIPFDLGKAVAASLLGTKLRRQLRAAGLL